MNLGLASFSRSVSSLAYAGYPRLRNGLLSLPSSLRAWWASPTQCPQLLHFSQVPRAGLLLLALIFASTSLIAEWHFAAAWFYSKDFTSVAKHVHLAQVLFPWDYRIRTSPAYLYAQTTSATASPTVALDEVLKAAKYNPYAADLRVNAMKLYLQAGILAGAHEQFMVLKSIVPSAPLIGQLEKAGMK